MHKDRRLWVWGVFSNTRQSFHDVQMVQPFKDIGNRIVMARSALGLTQAEFARLAGLKPSTVNQWETGAQRVSLNGALILREKYGLPLDFIFCGSVEALPTRIAAALSARPSRA